MATTADSYCKISDMIQTLLQERQSNPSMKLAFAFEGGGAKGVYQAGLMEGFAQLLASQGGVAALRPDIIAATSVGSIVGYALWVELMYPGGSTAPYALRQSSLWRSLAEGPPPNQAAEQLLKPGVLIDYITNQKPIPFIANFIGTVQNLQSDWKKVQSDLSTLQTQMNTLSRDSSSLGLTLTTSLATTIGSTAALFETGSPFGNIVSSILSIFNNPSSAVTAVPSLTSAITQLPQDIITTLTTALGTLGAAANALASSLPSELSAVATDVGNLGSTSINLAVAGAQGASDALNLGADVVQLIANLTIFLELVAFFFVASKVAPGQVQPSPDTPEGVALATNVLSDHLLSPAGLRTALQTFLTKSPNVPSTGDPGVRADWLSRSSASPPPPELYLTGANLTDSRLMIYALAPAANIAKIANDATWVVDLAGSTRQGPPKYAFWPGPSVTNPIVNAVMTSAALPLAFPPIDWAITQDASVWNSTGNPSLPTRSIVVVDGGVLDQTPIDIAVQAGATHIVSFELDAIMSYNNFNTPNVNVQAPPKNMLDVYTNSFNALMTRVRNLMVIDRCTTNAAKPKAQIPIYRIGPIEQLFTIPIPGPPTRGPLPPMTGPIPRYDFLNFNGLWQAPINPGDDGLLLINLEDRFMQGYQDACLLSPPTNPPPPGILQSLPPGITAVVSPELANGSPAMNDPVFKDYLTRAQTSTNGSPTGRVSWANANMAWMAVTKAFPSTPL
jgi:predicted acylesterase/phospholipase RssA